MFELQRRLAIAAFFMAFVASACRPFSSSGGGSGGGSAGGPIGMGGGAGTGNGGGQGGDGGRDAVGGNAGNGGMGNGGGGSGGEGGATIGPRRILGLAYDTNANHWSTVQTDPTTGVLSTLSILPSLIDGVAQGMSTFQASTQQIYHIGGQNTLLVIDATSGALTNTIPLVGGNYSGVLNLETNLAGEVIGLAWDPTALHFDVVRIDVPSGALVPLASLPSQYTSLAQAIGTFDALTNQMYEVTGENTLLTIDAATGALSGAISLDLGNYSGLMNIEANNAGEIMGLAYDSVAGQFDVVRVDPATSGLVPLAPVPQLSSGLAQGMGTFDPISNRMFEITGDGDLLIIDGTSGTPLGAIPILLGNYNGVMNLEAVP